MNQLGEYRTRPLLALIAATFVSAASIAPLGVVPLLYGLYADHLGLSYSQIGSLGAVEQLGSALGTMIAAWLVQRISIRQSVFVGCVVATVAIVLVGLANRFGLMLGLRFVTGLGSTYVYACTLYSLGQTADSARWYGASAVLNGVFASATTLVVTRSETQFGYLATNGVVAVWFCAAAIAAFFLPTRRRPLTHDTARVTGHGARLGVALGGLIGMFLFQASTGAYWGYLERIGHQNHINGNDIGQALSVGWLGGLPAALVPAAIGSHYGRVWLIGISTAAMIAGFVGFALSTSALGFLWSAIALFSAQNCGSAYYMSIVADNDRSGRCTRLLGASIFVAYSAGPACAALILRSDSLMPLYVFSCGAAAMSFIVLLGAVGLSSFRGSN